MPHPLLLLAHRYPGLSVSHPLRVEHSTTWHWSRTAAFFAGAPMIMASWAMAPPFTAQPPLRCVGGNGWHHLPHACTCMHHRHMCSSPVLLRHACVDSRTHATAGPPVWLHNEYDDHNSWLLPPPGCGLGGCGRCRHRSGRLAFHGTERRRGDLRLGQVWRRGGTAEAVRERMSGIL
jgi:hypothetical protein